MRIGPVLTWFSSSGIESHMVVNETFEPWGICCNGNDDIIVTDHNNHKILVSYYKYDPCYLYVPAAEAQPDTRKNIWVRTVFMTL